MNRQGVPFSKEKILSSDICRSYKYRSSDRRHQRLTRNIKAIISFFLRQQRLFKMRILFILFFVCFLAIPLAMGCRPPGLPCSADADCCAPLVCNPWAGRCTKKAGPPAAANQLEETKLPPAENQH